SGRAPSRWVGTTSRTKNTPPMRVSHRPARRFDHGSVVLGIDPGTASTGCGVVGRRGGTLVSRGGGLISTSAGDPLELRLAAISSCLQQLIDEHRPAALAVEDIFFGRNVRTAFAVGQA